MKLNYRFCSPTRENIHRAALLVLALVLASPGHASINYWQEKQFSQQLVKLLPPRQIQWLPTNPPTLALLISTHATQPEGVAVILPPPGHHPDQGPISQGLRHQLVDNGWSTLSLQMPVIDTEQEDDLLALYDISQPRLDAALQLMREQNPQTRIILIAQGFSANVAVHYLRNHPELFNQNGESAIKGLVLISLPGREASGNWLDSSEQLQHLTLPILDIFAEHDRQDVTDSAPQRLRSSHIAGRANLRAATPHTPKVRELAQNKTGNPRYRQQQLNGAEAGFPRQNRFLIKAIRSWLEENPQ